VGIDRKAWASASPIRAIFKQAIGVAGLLYFHRHRFRSTLVQLSYTPCQTPEEVKAWSQNLGHEGVLTTFCSYGTVAPGRQGEIIKNLSMPRPPEAGRGRQHRSNDRDAVSLDAAGRNARHPPVTCVAAS